MKNTGFYVAYSHFMGIGPHKFSTLMSLFPDMESAYWASQKELGQAVGVNLAARFIDFRNSFNIHEKLEDMASCRIRVITREDPRYPPQLLNLTDPPICLYAKGNSEVVDFSNNAFFSIVGTRSPTSYGLYISELFATALASHFVIVSGLALGVDYSAHSAALDAGGKTIAFLGCGVDIPSPRENTDLYNRIIDSGGLILSEFPPGMISLKGHFVSRNRLVSGISSGVLVVEGTKRSGTLITARYAAEQGKDVFAPPAPINSDKSEAPNMLIQNGAKMVLSPSDILEEYGFGGAVRAGRTINLEGFCEDEKKVVSILLNEPQRADDIIVSAGLAPVQAMNLLSILEVKGTIIKNADGRYALS